MTSLLISSLVFAGAVRIVMIRFMNRLRYGTPNTSEVTGIFVDNQKFVLTIRNLCCQSELNC